MLMRLSLYLSLLCTAIEIRNSQISFVFVTVFGIKTLRRLGDILTTNWIQLWDDFEPFLRQFGFVWGQSGGLSVNFRNFLSTNP